MTHKQYNLAHLACSFNKTEALTALYKYDARSFRQPDAGGYNVASLAAHHKNFSCLTWIAKTCPDLLYQADSRGRIPFEIYAHAVDSHTDLVQALQHSIDRDKLTTK